MLWHATSHILTSSLVHAIRTGSHIGCSSQATEGQWSKDGEGTLGWDDIGDDVGDGGSHEEVLSSLIFW